MINQLMESKKYTCTKCDNVMITNKSPELVDCLKCGQEGDWKEKKDD